MAPAKATRDLLVLETRAVVGTASSDTPAKVRKRVRKVLKVLMSAEKIKEFITPKAKKENVSDSPIAPRVTEPNFPGNRLSD